MNFLLNKIDTDIRRKVYEKTRDGKVHSKSEVKINKDSNKNGDKDSDKAPDRATKEEVKGDKSKKTPNKEGDIIQVQCEVDLNTVTDCCGNFLDVKK